MRIFFLLVFLFGIETLSAQDSKSLNHWSYVKMVHNPSIMLQRQNQYNLVLKSRAGDNQFNSGVAAIELIKAFNMHGSHGFVFAYENVKLNKGGFLETDQNIIGKYCYSYHIAIAGKRLNLGMSMGVLNHKEENPITGESVNKNNFNGDLGLSYLSRTTIFGLSLENFTNRSIGSNYTRSITAIGLYTYGLHPSINLIPSIKYTYQFSSSRNILVGGFLINHTSFFDLGVNYNSGYDIISPIVAFQRNNVRVSLAYDIYLKKLDEGNEKNIEALVRYR